MHDKNGTELKMNDRVLLEARITNLSPGSEFCNVTIESINGRRPDQHKEVTTLNTAVLVLLDRPKE